MKVEWTNKDVLTQSETTGQSKAILVIDEMPKSCADCRLKRGLFCGESGNSLYDYIHGDDNINVKPEWCPLKPLPKRNEYRADTKHEDMDKYSTGYADGWNDCLDEITGETE